MGPGLALLWLGAVCSQRQSWPQSGGHDIQGRGGRFASQSCACCSPVPSRPPGALGCGQPQRGQLAELPRPGGGAVLTLGSPSFSGPAPAASPPGSVRAGPLPCGPPQWPQCQSARSGMHQPLKVAQMSWLAGPHTPAQPPHSPRQRPPALPAEALAWKRGWDPGLELGRGVAELGGRWGHTLKDGAQ